MTALLIAQTCLQKAETLRLVWGDGLPTDIQGRYIQTDRQGNFVGSYWIPIVTFPERPRVIPPYWITDAQTQG